METSQAVLPKRFILTTHLLSLVLPAFLIALIMLTAAESPSFGKIILGALVYTIMLTGFIFLYYLLAGGMDWRNQPLPTSRIVLFWALSALGIGFILNTIWSLVRLILAKTYKIPVPQAMGRLLSTRATPSSWPAETQATTHTCEKCGTRSSLGQFYTFVCGDFVTADYTSTSTARWKKTTYRIFDSDPAFICNKCVCLEGERQMSRKLNRILLVSLAALVVLIPLSSLMDNILFMLPLFVLALIAPITLYLKISLERRECVPQQAYKSVENKEEYLATEKSWAGILIRNRGVEEGERIAIILKKPLLSKNGVDAFFTHAEARTKLS